jgi:hypothetical protein
MRRWLTSLAVLLMVAAVAGLIAVLTNLPRFDEPLLPELEALRKSKPAPLDDNAYPFALGFLSAKQRDPRAAGVEIIGVLQARRDRGEPATIGKEEKQAILGAPLANDGLGIGSRSTEKRPSAQVSSLGLICQPRHRLDCANRLIATAASLDPNEPRLALLFARYETLLRQAHYVETPAPDPLTPWPPLGPIVELGRLRLAISFRTDPTAVFLEKASQELAFWRMTMREAQLFGTKMSALAAIRWANDFLSTLMRERQLDARDLAQLRGFVRPFTREESDIGAAFLSESRTSLLGGTPSVAGDASWVVRLLLQKNATFNQEFRETIEPLRVRASLDARQYHDDRAYEPLRNEFHVAPGVFYNLGGKLALSRSTWDGQLFPARVHDEDGRITLLLLQAEIEEHPDLDVATLVRSPTLRNPYTGEAMEYDARTGTIGFGCLHTAFHPPEPADQCAVALRVEIP